MRNDIPVLIRSMEGIGDQIYQRPFIKHLVHHNKHVYISTFLPDIYRDIKNLKFVDPTQFASRTYRTQQKQFDTSQHVKYSPLPKKYVEINPSYNGAKILNTSIVANMANAFGVKFDVPLKWDLPDYTEEYESAFKKLGLDQPETRNEKIAIVRPATVRSEWVVKTRNPKPDYIAWCSKVLIEHGYTVVSIADLSPEEKLVGNPPQCHLQLHNGNLGIYGTLELIKRADIVVGGPGFIVPASISTDAKLFTIFGGRLAYDTPYKIFHGSMNMQNIGWAVPDNPCRCTANDHDCNKTISDLDTRFMEFLSR